MARLANVKIVDIEKEYKDSRYNDDEKIKVVSAQEYDNKNKSLHLSLNKKNPRRCSDLEKILEIGGCYQVVVAQQIITDSKGKQRTREYIDFLGNIKKLPTSAEAKTSNKELITSNNIDKVSLDTQLKKISKITFETRKYVDGIDEVVAVIREEFNIKG